jgi:uncharacterized phage infection (PIP) family protein YhgE
VDAGSQQVAQAGERMEEIVSSVRRVSDLIGEISAAAGEQRDGINQVNQAISGLDQMTQQNAALVEQSTAAATSMRDQAQRLAQSVAVFNVGANVLAPQAAASAHASAALAASASGSALASSAAVPVPQTRLRTAKPPVAKPAPSLLPSVKTESAQGGAAGKVATADDSNWEVF